MTTKNYLTFDGNLLTFNSVYLYFPTIVSHTGNDEFFYPHTCVVYRSGGYTDDAGNEIFTGLYYGDCAYEVNTNGSTRLQGLTFKADSFLLLPCTDVLFQINDMVVIETENGRTISATIEQFETVDVDGIEGTTAWLKQAE
jgi:hypothetical protein